VVNYSVRALVNFSIDDHTESMAILATEYRGLIRCLGGRQRMPDGAETILKTIVKVFCPLARLAHPALRRPPG
jgi:hypothetical protein